MGWPLRRQAWTGGVRFSGVAQAGHGRANWRARNPLVAGGLYPIAGRGGPDRGGCSGVAKTYRKAPIGTGKPRRVASSLD